MTIHYTPLADDPFGLCGEHAPLCTDDWGRVTCTECLARQPKEKTTSARAMRLVGTSVQDLQSSLNHYKWYMLADEQVVRSGLAICKRRGEKTKVKILERWMKHAAEHKSQIVNPK